MVSASASLTYSLGQFGVIIDREWEESRDGRIFPLTDNNIYGDVNIRDTGFNEILNRITVRYNERSSFEYEEQITVEIAEDNVNNRNENEPVLERTLRSIFTNNKVEAERLAYILLNKSRRTQTLQVYTCLLYTSPSPRD